jgi:hypothetical protein
MDCGLEQSELYAYQQCGSACTMFVTTAPNFEMGICNHTPNSPDIVTVVRWKNHPDNWLGSGAICDTCTTLVNIQLMQFMKLLFQQCALTKYSATNTQRVYLQCSNFNFDFFITSSSGFRKLATFSSDFWRKPQRTSSY